MGEIKSVKVDNWGVFFLQKLQNFFNKTDYCDLTLQFNDNSQLKVHRLVLSACTDYFNVLEQTCEMIEDVLIMPPELQADVVVPIVNFMYTGTLEFELKMYGRLLKTAKDMNMTVLLKLLEAHRRTMEGNKPQTLNKNAPKTVRRIHFTSPKRPEERTYATQSTSTTPQRRSQITHSTPQYKTLQIKPVPQNLFPRNLPEPAQIVTKYPHTKTPVKGPSRFECNEDTLPPETFEKSFDNISYESKPLICKEEPDAFDYDNLIRKHETYASPFEQLRRGYTNNNNKRPASSVSSYESPPEKKPNIQIQDVKEYAEQQRVRKQIAEEFDDDQEYDEVLDDEFHNDDDDDEYVPPQSVRRQIKQQQQQQQQQSQQAKGKETQKVVKQETGPRPTIVVKDTTSSNVNHAKIISEVLRKYPHLVKNSKNIKLKIMPQSNNSQKIVIKKENCEADEPSQEVKPRPMVSVPLKQTTPQASSSNAPSSTAAVSTQPRRIDSKTMHALIALGAENKTGPWLCLRCGVNGRPISIPSYRGFRRHLINTHKEKIDPRLCEHCGWRSSNNKELAHHMFVEHSVKTQQYNFPKCDYCTEISFDYDALEKHVAEKHTIKKEQQTCIYCNRSFAEEIQLYTHMKAFHKERATGDGVLDFSDGEVSFGEGSESQLQDQAMVDNRIKIISDISLPKNLPVVQATAPATVTTLGLGSPTEGTSVGSVSTGIPTSLKIIGNDESHILTNEYIGTDSSSQGPKFVNADGNEMDLTPAQREEIISQLDQQHDGIVMVLNEEPFDATSVENTRDNTVAATESEHVTGNSMFIVCGQETETVSEQSMPLTLDKEKSKTKDPLEWTAEETSNQSNTTDKDKKNDENENEVVTTKVDAGGTTSEKSIDMPVVEKSKEVDDKEKNSTCPGKPANKSPNDSLEMKLKLLTDWTDDEEEEEEEEEGDQEKLEPELAKSSEKEENETSEKNGKEEILFETVAEIEENIEEPLNKNNAEEEPETKTDNEQENEKDKSTENKTDVDEKEPDESFESGLDKDSEELECSKEDDGKSESEQAEEKSEAGSPQKVKDEDDQDAGKLKNADSTGDAGEPSSKEEKEDPNLITKAELRNIMSDWGDDDDDDEM